MAKEHLKNLEPAEKLCNLFLSSEKLSAGKYRLLKACDKNTLQYWIVWLHDDPKYVASFELPSEAACEALELAWDQLKNDHVRH